MSVTYNLKEVSTETGESEDQGKWSKLPSLLLEKIYSYLSPADRVNMSVVCHNWSKGYGSPVVWKNFKFVPEDQQLKGKTWPLMKFVLKYGKMFRHLEIGYGFISRKRDFCRHLIEFLDSMENNKQLTSIKFCNLERSFHKRDDTIRDDVIRSIVKILKSQDCLKKLEFDNCFSNFEVYLDLLKALNEKSRNSIVCLELRNLSFLCTLQTYEEGSDIAQNLLTLKCLEKLTKALDVKYSLIFENMLSGRSYAAKTVHCPQRLVLSKIIIDYDEAMRNILGYEELMDFDWRHLTELYPNLQIELIMKTYSPRLQEVESLIVPNMPITRLNFINNNCVKYSDSPPPMMDTEDLLHHLLDCKTNDELIYFSLEWTPPIPNFNRIFIPFLQACRKLKRLDLNIAFPNDGLHTLMKSWLENRPESLKEVNIFVNCYDNVRAVLMKSIIEYAARLESVGLKLEIDYSTENKNCKRVITAMNLSSYL